MGYDNRVLDTDFECTAIRRPKPSSCISTVCYNGDCVNTQTATGLEYSYCECDWGWQGYRCTECCSLPCQNGGECVHFEGYRFCNCIDTRYVGVYCEEIKSTTTLSTSSLNSTFPPEEIQQNPFWNKYTISVVSSMVVVSIVLIVFLVIVPYILYKKRNIFILKMMYRFKKFEDDDSRTYDVFLWYRSQNDKDRRFVTSELLPGIEHMGFTTWTDQRESLVEAATAEAIKNAIQESRRTIIVVSPAYIQGEWPEFEVQCATIESLRKAHHIIPIIFEPINDYRKHLSPTLARILNSITYTEWPPNPDDPNAKAEFWRRLKFLLPRKKEMAKEPTELVVTGNNNKPGSYPILLGTQFENGDDQY